MVKSADGNERNGVARKNTNVLGVLLSIGSAILLVLTNSIIKGLKVDFADAIFVQSVGQVVILAMIICTKGSYFWVWEVDQDKNINQVRCTLVFGAMAGSMSRLTDLVAITFAPLGDVMTIIFSNVVPTTILAAIVFKERLRMIKVLCMLLVVTGIVLVIRPPFLFRDELNTEPWTITPSTNSTISFHSIDLGTHDIYYYIGAISAISCMIFRSITRLSRKYLLQNKGTSNGELIVFYFGVASLIISLVLPFAFAGNQRIINSSNRTKAYHSTQWLGLFGYAALSYAISWMRIRAIALIGAVMVAFMCSTEILLSYTVQIILFDTLPSVSATTGSFCIITACALILIEDSIIERLPEKIKNIF